MRMLFLATLLSISLCAHAQDERQALAGRFVSILKYEVQFQSAREQCDMTYKTVSPNKLIQRNPNYFNGIRPGDKRWSAVNEAYAAYFEEACSRPTLMEFLGVMSASYAETLSSDQLKDAIAFYSTPTGSALVVAHKSAAGAVYEAWTNIHSKHLADITARFQSKLSELVQAK